MNLGCSATRALFLLPIIAILLGLAACGGEPVESGRGNDRPATVKEPVQSSLMIITLDTWRWDHIGISGSGRVETPTLDRLAGAGIYESEVVTPCPLTTPAHATMFTGLHPLNHRVLDCTSYSLPKGIPTLAEVFQEKGYRTAAFVSSQTLKRQYGLDRGHELYDDSGITKRGSKDWLTGTKDGLLTTEATLSYMDRSQGTQPLFIWVHYFDAHHPYRSRPEYDGKYPGRPYAAQVNFLDGQVARLLAATEADPGRQWRFLIVGDHGEGLGDRHEVGHGYGLYRSTLHVPLILYPKPDAPLEYPKPWSLLDIDPTVREWFQLPARDRSDGKSLFQEASESRSLSCLTLLPSFAFSVNPNFGIRKGSVMYMRHGKEEIYDLVADPDQRRNLVSSENFKEQLGEARSECREAFPLEDIQKILDPTLEQSMGDLESLMGLGYVGGLAPRLDTLQRADIREVIKDFSGLEAARIQCFHGGSWPLLEEKYREFLAKYTKAYGIYSAYGKDLLNRGKLEDAARQFEIALKGRPEYADMVNLGTLYLQMGKVQEGQVLLETALTIRDDDAALHMNLGILYYQYNNQPERALPHFEQCLALDPDYRDAGKIRELVRRLKSPPS